MEYHHSFRDQLDINFISHHGIKGQKWGVRRYQNQDGSLTDLGKKRYSSVTNYGETGGVIPKNSSLYRITSTPNERYRKKDITFVSTSKFDNAMWQDGLSAFYGENLYSISMQTMKDVKVAPQTAIGKAYIKQQKEHPWRTRLNTNDAMYVFDDKSKMLNVGYNTYRGGANIALESPTGRRMIEDLRKQGYDAIPDVVGKDTANDPLIVLNPRESVGNAKIMQTHSVTVDDSKTRDKKTEQNNLRYNKNYLINRNK